MSRVQVTFEIEADDPGDHTGVSNETYEDVVDAIMQLGGENIDFEVIDDD